MEWGKIASIFQMPFANMGLLVITYNCFNLNMMICSCSSKLLWIHWFYRRKSWKKLSKVLSSLKQLSHIIIHFSFAQNSPKYWDLYWKLVAALYLTACKVVDNISSDQSLWLSSWELREWSHLPLIQAHFKCYQLWWEETITCWFWVRLWCSRVCYHQTQLWQCSADARVVQHLKSADARGLYQLKSSAD